MSDLVLDLDSARSFRPINGTIAAPPATEEDLALAQLGHEDRDVRYAPGQWVQTIGPAVGSKIRPEGPARTKIVKRVTNGYMCEKWDGCLADGKYAFVHDNAMHREPTQWRPIPTPIA